MRRCHIAAVPVWKEQPHAIARQCVGELREQRNLARSVLAFEEILQLCAAAAGIVELFVDADGLGLSVDVGIGQRQRLPAPQAGIKQQIREQPERRLGRRAVLDGPLLGFGQCPPLLLRQPTALADLGGRTDADISAHNCVREDHFADGKLDLHAVTSAALPFKVPDIALYV